MNKKKLIAILTLMCFMFTLAPVAAMAATELTDADGIVWVMDQEKNKIVYTQKNDLTKVITAVLTEGVLTFSGNGPMPNLNTSTDFVSGSNIGGGYAWSSWKSSTTKIIIEDGITSVGAKSFIQWSATTVEIGKDVEKLGAGAFAQMGARQFELDEENESFVLENGVLYNADKTTLYYYCKNEVNRNFEVPATVTLIGYNAFMNAGLEEITFAVSAEDLILGFGCFANSSAAKIQWSERITEVSSSVFSGYNGKVYCPNVEIRNMLLRGISFATSDDIVCPDEEYVTDSSGVTYYAAPTSDGDYFVEAVDYTPGNEVKSLIIPDKVTFKKFGELTLNSIGRYAFENNAASDGRKISSVVIPASVKYIGYEAFLGASNNKGTGTLHSVKILGNEIEIADRAFIRNSNLTLDLSSVNKNNGISAGMTSKVPYLVVSDAKTADGKSAKKVLVTNGGTFDSVMDFATEANAIADPVCNGYDFEGWYSDYACTDENKKTSAQIKKTDGTYYAKWTLNEDYVELTFDANDGTDTPATVVKVVKKGEAYTLPTDLFTRAGYTLTGWVDANTTITPTENLTLKAKWTLEAPTIDVASGDINKTVNKPYDGEPVKLFVTASHVLNDAELSYQWKKDETVLTTTSSSLVLAGNVADSGTYTCIVTATDRDDNTATAEQAFTVEITNAVISGITVTGYSGIFDNNAHTITYTIPDGTTIKFATTTGSVYNLAEAPSYAGVGEYPVYYQVTKDNNYASVEGNVNIIITKATQAIDYATKAITKVVGDATFTNELEKTRVYGSISYESSDETVATIDTVGEVTIVGAGTATITAKAAGSNNYDEKTASYTLTVQPKAEYTPSTSTSSGFTGSYNYPVSTPAVDNGDVKLSDSNAVEGESVTVTVAPDNGYGVAEVIVTDEDGNIIPVEFIGNGQYTFTMPDGEVSVEVVCKPAITMVIGDTVLNIFGKIVKNDVAPTIGEGNRTMLPIRAVANAMGAEVYWDADNQKVTIVKDGKVIEVFIGKDYAFVDGERIELDAKAYIENDRTYLQVRFVTEALDAQVIWDPVKRMIAIIPE